MPLFRKTDPPKPNLSDSCRSIAEACRELQQAKTRGGLGEQLAKLILAHPPSDINRMRRNFGRKIQELPAEYRERLTKKINEHLMGTYQAARLRSQDGSFQAMTEPVPDAERSYWEMVAGRCSEAGDGDPAIRFLNYLLAAFCMFVLREPAHPVGTPFPGGDTVQRIEGVYYCPVREKAGDVDAALCPFCPARQTPSIGYLRPPVGGSGARKQEYIDHIHRGHHFNG